MGWGSGKGAVSPNGQGREVGGQELERKLSELAATAAAGAGAA